MLDYRLLGQTGLKVSEICLGTMSFGETWGFGADEKTSHQVLSTYADAGGNFLDTANKYHDGETEEICGKWLEGQRHRYVVATKYTLAMDHDDPNTAGNTRKNLVRSVEKSLERLRTDYIDLLWVHAWDTFTPWQETVRALDDLVRAGKILHIGVSDTPAWVVSASNTHAELRGWSQYCGVQIEYSLIQRTVERDLIPMAKHYGMSVLGWAPLGGGLLAGKYTRDDAEETKRKEGNEGRGRFIDRNFEIARAVDAVADELGVTSAQVATAWALQQGYWSIPIVGARKVSQIEDTLGAANLDLGEEHLAKLDDVSQIELGFPGDFLTSDRVLNLVRTESRSRIVEPH